MLAAAAWTEPVHWSLHGVDELVFVASRECIAAGGAPSPAALLRERALNGPESQQQCICIAGSTEIETFQLVRQGMAEMVEQDWV